MTQPTNFGAQRTSAEGSITPEGWAVQVDESLDALATMHSGASRPSYIQAGMKWLDTSSTPWIMNLYDGSNDIPLFAIHPINHKAQVNFFAGSNIASAAALTIPGDGNVFTVTGTTTITSINTLRVGSLIVLRFGGALTLTHGANLVLPNGENIVTQAGDYAMFHERAAGVWECVGYSRPIVNEFSENVTISTSSGDAYLDLRGIAGTTRGMVLRTSASRRWLSGASSVSEEGSNTGSDYFINRYDDAGNYLSTPVIIRRQSGLAQFGNGLVSNNGNITIINSWAGFEARATDPSGFGYLDMSSANRQSDYDWRINADPGVDENLDISYGGSAGSGPGHRFRLTNAGDVWTATYGWLHDYIQAQAAPMAVLEDQKPQNTNGEIVGTANAWVTRTLNTIVRNQNTVLALSANRFTPAFNGWVEFEGVVNHNSAQTQLRLVNVTDGVEMGRSTSHDANSNNSTTNVNVVLSGGGPVTAGKQHEIQVNSNSAVTYNGFRANRGTEVYLRVKYWRT